MQIIKANKTHIVVASELFDLYRQFYGQQSNQAAAKAFVTERITKNDSEFFLALSESEALGFVQLYPSFTSVGMARIYILNDLYVTESARSKGVGAALIRHSENFAQEVGAKRLSLATEISNLKAQALYERLGWEKDINFFHYNRTVVA